MNRNQIEIRFLSSSKEIGKSFHNSNEKIKEVFKKFTNQTNINFNAAKFLLNEKILNKEDYDKPISHFASVVNNNILNIKIDNIYETRLNPQVSDKKTDSKNYVINDNDNDLNHNPVISNNNNINDNHSKNNDNKLNKNNNIPNNNEISGIAYSSEIHNIGRVKKDVNIEIGNNKFDKTFDNSSADRTNKKETLDNINGRNQIKEKEKKNNDSCFKKNKKIFLIILIAGIILIIALIIVLVVVLKKKKKVKDDIVHCEMENCLICEESKYSKYCLNCNYGFELHNGECIQYAFVATYNYPDNSYGQILNPNKIDSLYAMKTYYFSYPTSEYFFHDYEDKKVYFYLKENENVSLSYLFEGIENLIDFSFNEDYINNFTIIDMQGMFLNCISLTYISFYPFEGNDLVDISYLFSNCTSLESLNLSSLISQNVKDMGNMFSDCIGLISLDISNFDSQNVINMTNLFYNCENLTSIDLSNLNTKNVEFMNYMFYNCSSLESLNLLNFNTENVKDMGNMFSGCISLTSLALYNFNTQNVETMEYMFSFCTSLEKLDLSNFRTYNVINMTGMFYNCSSLMYLDISNFVPYNVINKDYMFYNCSSLIEVYSKFGILPEMP